MTLYAAVTTFTSLALFGGVFFWHLWAPPGWRPADLASTFWVPLLAGVVFILAGLVVLGRHIALKQAKAALAGWTPAFDTASTEAAAAEFYTRLFLAGTAGRAAAVTMFLLRVPAGRCRTLTVGDVTVAPVDDGSLNEECDAFEGRAKASMRWLALLMTLPFIFQIVLAFSSDGLNVFTWSGWKFLTIIPAVFNLVLMAYLWGFIRPLGVVVLCTPGRVQFGSLRGVRVFTTDDTVMLIGGAQQQFVAMLYRNDGQRAYVRYSSLKTPGFQQLLSRWCVVHPGAEAMPEAGESAAPPAAGR